MTVMRGCDPGGGGELLPIHSLKVAEHSFLGGQL